MTWRDAVDFMERHGGLVPAAAVRGIVEQAMGEAGPEILSTVQAARLIGYSPRWWGERCAAGEIEGAYQDSGYWRFPAATARAYLARHTRVTGARRGRSKTPPPPTAQARTPGVQDGQVLAMRPATVGRRAGKRPQPKGPRLA